MKSDNHNQPLPRVCVIGCGSSGLPTLTSLVDRGFDFDCFEASDEIGGNWTYRNSNNMSAAYESLHINTHAGLMAYADHPMPDSTPDFPSHRLIKAYFDDYVDNFGLREKILFQTKVTNAERLADGSWKVTTTGKHAKTDYYDALIVANGHHWDPRWPAPDEYAGEFSGEQMHAHSYMTPDDPVNFKGKNVLVVGMGNSAMDIASELSRAGLAKNLYISARHGHWVVPKYAFGKPITDLAALPHWMPWWVTSAISRVVVALTVGAPQNYGLQKPDHKLLQSHPTVSSDFLQRVGSGDVIPRPGITQLAGSEVEFTDGNKDEIDIIIWATGYNVTFPFFDADFIAPQGNDLPRWNQTLMPEYDNLFFVGLFQPLGAIMPLAEKQAKIIADHLAGNIHFPSRAQMRKEMAGERAAMTKRYGRSPRHTMQVDNEPFHHTLDMMRKHGEKRARKAGNTLPVGPKSSANNKQEAA